MGVRWVRGQQRVHHSACVCMAPIGQRAYCVASTVSKEKKHDPEPVARMSECVYTWVFVLRWRGCTLGRPRVHRLNPLSPSSPCPLASPRPYVSDSRSVRGCPSPPLQSLLYSPSVSVGTNADGTDSGGREGPVQTPTHASTWRYSQSRTLSSPLPPE